MAFAADNMEHMYLRILNTSQELGEHNNYNDSNNNNNSEDDTDDSIEYTIADYPGILDVNLTTFSLGQRVAFIVTISLLCVLSVCGNIGTLYVNVRRKIRPFFRACLISLAISDLLTTVFLTVAYVTQITADYVQLWRLGPLMCGIVPFATTAAILASGMTLVGIALDRYFAVMRAVIGFWNPGVIFCIVCMFIIWATAIGIASPVFCIFSLFPVYILTEENVATTIRTPVILTPAPPPLGPLSPPKLMTPNWEQESSGASSEESQEPVYTLVNEQQLVLMCASQKHHVGLYYAIVFVIIFIPSIVAFIWLNSIIAKKLWIRRHTVKRPKRQKNNSQLPSHKPEKPCKPKTNSKCTKNSLKLLTAHTKATMPAADANTTPKCFCQPGQSQSSTMPSSVAVTMGGGPLQCHGVNHCAAATKMAAKTAAAATCTSGTGTGTSTESACSTRESRHIRMFTIIILLMTVFIFFRLPAWIFLVMRMYGSYTKPVHWILYFSFGILNLTSCVLNPLFYTFLAQTIQFVVLVRVKLSECCCGWTFKCCRRQEKVSASQMRQTDTGAWVIDGGTTDGKRILCAAQPPVVLKEDKDEGVDCGDEGDSMNERCCDCQQRIYTIYPPTLVSSSMATE